MKDEPDTNRNGGNDAGCHSTPLTPFFSEKDSLGSYRGATPTALRGRANPFDIRRHAHAEPWAWHPEMG